MPNYNSLKVVDLKDLLKERDLVYSGTKPELIARLEEDDAKKAATTTEEVATTTEPTKPDAPANVDVTPSTVEVISSDEPTGVDASTDDNQTVDTASTTTSSEDSKDSDAEVVIAELEKRIVRLNKYGQPEEAAELRKQIDRIRKLGISDVKGANKILRSVQNLTKSSVNKASNKYGISDDVLAKRRAKFASSN